MKRAIDLAAVFLSLLCVPVLLSCSSSTENREPYPNRAIEVIVPFAPGGGSDTFARIIKAEIDQQKLLPHPLVIINAPGAGGTIGSRRVLNEKPDGYTVLLLHDGILTARHSGKVLYGPEAFQQVAATGRSGMVIAVHENSEFDSLNDLLNAAADNPDTITFAANLGAPSHFVGLMVEQAHGTAEFRFAQSGGGADRFTAVKGKHVEATAFSLEEYLRFKPDGIKAVAFLGNERHQEVPDIPTAIEQGIEVEQSVMQYWWMPKGTPPERAERFAKVLLQALNSENVKNTLASMKIDPEMLTGKELAAHLYDSNMAFAKVDPGNDSPLPNVPMVLAGFTLFFAILVGVQKLRPSQDVSSEIDSDSEIGLSNKQWQLVVITATLVIAYAVSVILLKFPLGISTTLFLIALGLSNKQWQLVVFGAALVVAYAVSVILLKFPLGISTTLFLMALGLVLSGEARKSGQKFVLPVIVTSSIVVGILFHFVFTKLFEIGL